ncbi:D-alanyl-D-alanine carboxypeptidase family protein [Bacillus seohaeanensis]|jgi:D-alanyl-D-alanine carboxypeptidase|uniref:D-alanyl-D-alanine carboxypeptidase family protein n=1 Tax=Bacillus seohaeanensis TaxID=284580 RepID=A0ABW5RX40_9BACI
MKKIMFIVLILSFSFSVASAEEIQVKKPSSLFSKSAIVIDSKTRSILYSKKANRKMNPASITKIATAIYALENGDLDDTVTISKNAASTEGSSVYLMEGEKMSLKQLLQGMMVNSGNDAAVAIAEHLEGSVENFSDHVNTFLQEKIGVQQTHFVNPHGLYNKNHYTTAYDMAIITSYALNNAKFKSLFGTEEVDWKAEGWETKLITHHKMVKGELPYPEVTGGKNGFVDEAMHTLVTSAENKDLSVVVVTLKAQSKNAIYRDTKALLDYSLNGFVRNTIPKETIFQLEDQSYKLNKDVEYTHAINERIKERLSPDGMLTLFNEDHSKNLTVQLTKKKKETALQENNSLASAHGSIFSSDPRQLLLYPMMVYIIMLAIAGVSIFRYKQSNM